MRPPEEVKRELLEQWLAKAEEDLNAAKALLTHNVSFLFAVGFHSQQAAEKYLKAFLTWHQIEFPKTHNLGELLDLVSTVDSLLADSLQYATTLNPYGVDIRYPGDIPDMAQKDAQEAVELAGKVRDAILQTLPAK